MSTDRDKAREVVEHHNRLWNDVTAYPQHLTDAIATALAEVRRETWEAAIKIVKEVSTTRWVRNYGDESDTAVSFQSHAIAALESAKEKDEHGKTLA